jgi:hypothetical protein
MAVLGRRTMSLDFVALVQCTRHTETRTHRGDLQLHQTDTGRE